MRNLFVIYEICDVYYYNSNVKYFFIHFLHIIIYKKFQKIFLLFLYFIKIFMYV